MFLPGESQGRGSLVGYRLWGHTGSDMTEATYGKNYAAQLAIVKQMTGRNRAAQLAIVKQMSRQ